MIDRNRRSLWMGVLVGGLALAVVGQVEFVTQSSGSRVGVILYALAVGMVLAAAGGLRRLAETDAGAAGAEEVDWRTLVWLPAALLSLSALLWVLAVRLSLLPSGTPGQFRAGFVLWGISVALFVGAFVARGPRPAVWTWPGTRVERLALAAIAVITGVGLLLRAVNITGIPYPLQGDEGSIGREAMRILDGQVTNMFRVGWSGQPYMSFLPTALFIRLLGPDIAGVRMVSVLEGIAAIPLLYLLGRRLFGWRIGLMAALFLAGWHFHIHFNRVAVHNGGDAFFAGLVLWLTVRAVQTRRVLDYVWAGFAAGLTWYSYVGARLVFALVLWYLLFVIVRERRFLSQQWRGLLAFGTAIGVVGGPQMLYFWLHPAQFMTRFSQVGLLQSGWLAQEAVRRQVAPVSILFEHLSRAFLVFISFPALGGFYNAPVPLLDPVSAVLFILGLAYCMTRLLDARYFLVASWFWADVILGGALTVDVPNVGRLVLAAPAVSLFVALALALLVEALHKGRLVPEQVGHALAGVVLVGTLLHSVNFYFREFIPRHHFVDAHSELGHVMGYYLQGLGGGYSAYFAGAPRVFIDFPSIPYLAPAVAGQNIQERITEQTVTRLAPTKPAVFLAIPERRAELELIRQTYPGGTWREFPSRAKAEMLFVAYELPPGD